MAATTTFTTSDPRTQVPASTPTRAPRPQASLAAVANKFWDRVLSAPKDECWLWTGTRTEKGYGRFVVAPGVRLRAHRVSWELTNGPIPNGLWVLHRCDNPSCCNPAHLFLGTNADNSADRDRKGRNRVVTIGEAHPRAKLTWDKVAELKVRHARGDVTYRSLAIEYGVCETTVRCAILEIYWKDNSHAPDRDGIIPTHDGLCNRSGDTAGDPGRPTRARTSEHSGAGDGGGDRLLARVSGGSAARTGRPSICVAEHGGTRFRSAIDPCGTGGRSASPTLNYCLHAPTPLTEVSIFDTMGVGNNQASRVGADNTAAALTAQGGTPR